MTQHARPIVDRHTFRRLCRARDLAAASVGRPVLMEELAREACLSPWHFHRLFTATFGQTPAQYLSMLRMEKAKRLLASGNISVTEACFEAGYVSLGSFSTRFRDAVGVPPSVYQREVRRVYGTMAPWRFVFIPTCFLSVHRGAE